MALVNKEEEHEFEINKGLINSLAQQDGKLVSPIDLSLDITTQVELEKLKWMNLDEQPVKMKLTNTGETVIISGKWASERPYLAKGPLDSNYVFSQIHFHWGSDEREGSEHTVNGICYPMEVHVVFFKTRYLTQEAALKKDDGIIIMVYLVKLQNKSTPGLEWLCSYLDKVVQPNTSTVLPLSPLSTLLVPFTKDYLLYWGSLVTHRCSHTMLWFVSRAALSVSVDSLNVFRKLLNSRKEAMIKNFRGASSPQGRSVFHVNPSKETKHLLLPGVIDSPGQALIVSFSEMPALDQKQAQQIFNQGDSTDDESAKFYSKNKDIKQINSTSKTFYFCKGLNEEERNNKTKANLCNNYDFKIGYNESCSYSAPNSSSSHIIPHQMRRDHSLLRTKTQKRNYVMSRKVLERERKLELDKTKRKLTKRNERFCKEGYEKVVKGMEKADTSLNQKITTIVRASEPYIAHKEDEQANDDVQPMDKEMKPEEVCLRDEICLHYNSSQISSAVSESQNTEKLLNYIKANPEVDKTLEPEKEITTKENSAEKEKHFKSKLPVRKKVLQSSLAPLFAKPESAPHGQKDVKLNGRAVKPSTPMQKERAKRPITFTIPKQ